MSVLRTWVLTAMLLTAAVFSQEVNAVQVQLKQGSIFATPETVGDGRLIYSFQGIPFAKPPVGDLRFMEPVAADGWLETRNGSWIPPECPQPNFLGLHPEEGMVVGNEDCLYLNVFTPRPFHSDLPVMVFIHNGGTFYFGGVVYYQPLPLLTKDIVLVTLQYRLGVLGFLSTEDSVLPGNMGMKDQILALKWVQENIKEFGGDPNKVTIFGESAGAASVHFHMLSPYSKGLFQKAILQSGNMICPWALYDDHRVAALKIAKSVNCSSESREFLACLKKADVNSLVIAPEGLDHWNRMPAVTVPRVDGDYLPEHPAALLKKGNYNKVPLMTGVNKDEGNTYTLFIRANPQAVQALKENFNEIGPVALGFTKVDNDPAYLARRVFYHYLGVPEFPLDNLEGFNELMGDCHFRKGHHDVTDMHARDSVYGDNVYLYELHHRGFQSLVQVEGVEHWVGHGDDIQYLFNASHPFKPLQRDDDIFVSEIMVALWTNFAATGNPTPDLSLGFKWSPRNETDRQYLSITTSPSMQKDSYSETREFWRNLPTEVNKILYPEHFL